MKKISFFILMTALVAATVQAQNSMIKKKGNWGIKTGLNLSNIRTEDGPDSDWKTGLAAGVFFTIKAGSKFSIQPEFLYSSMGGKNVVNNLGNTGFDITGSSLRLNYFSLPLLAKFQVKNRFAVVAGPQVDVLIMAKTKSSTNQFSKVTDNYRENSFNATAGFELWPSHCFGLTARYIYGLNNIAATGIANLKNQGVQIMAAVKL
ncbi:MAG TPA: porin family protein [Flavisolibacter sp.]|jgi:hypothetical protein|nr:porin family protein [Flavisolibacter sp.]